MGIYDIAGTQIPSRGKNPGLAEFELLRSSPIDRTIDHISDNLDRQEKAANKQLLKINTLKDKVTGIRVDNPTQKALLDKAVEESGVNDAFNTMTLEQLKNPYGVSQIETKYNALRNHPTIRQLNREQLMADQYMKDVAKISDPGLRDLAMEDLNEYVEGKIDGTKLAAGNYKPIDIFNVLGKKFKDMSAKVKTDFERNNRQGVTYATVKKTKDKEALGYTFQALMADQNFKNNMFAKGFSDREGNLTPEGAEYVDNIMKTYEVDGETFTGIKHDKQVNQYEVNKNSTFEGSYNGNSTKNVNISGGSGEFMAGNSKAAQDHNALVKKYGKMGLSVTDIGDQVDIAITKGDQTDLFRAALRNDNTDLVNFVAKDWGLTPRQAAEKILKDNGLKVKPKDTAIRPDINTWDEKVRVQISVKAKEDANKWLEKNGKSGNPLKNKPKTETKVIKPKGKIEYK